MWRMAAKASDQRQCCTANNSRARPIAAGKWHNKSGSAPARPMRYVWAARALICRLPARACLVLGALRTALVATPAEVFAELGVEVPALYEPHGRDHAEAGREVFAGVVGHGIG